MILEWICGPLGVFYVNSVPGNLFFKEIVRLDNCLKFLSILEHLQKKLGKGLVLLEIIVRISLNFRDRRIISDKMFI